MQLLVSAFAISVAALTLVLGTRRLLVMGSRLVVGRWFWIGGVIAFSVEPTKVVDQYRIRFEVGGPGTFHNVSVHVRGLTESDSEHVPPQRRMTMNAGGDPIDFTFTAPDSDSAAGAWVVVIWVRPYLEGVESEAIAQSLHGDRLYEWRWYSETNRLARIGIRNWARRNPRRSTQRMRDLPIFGRWRVTWLSSGIELQGPIEVPLPR